MNLALYCPEIPQNVGAIMRSCAAFETNLHIIGPIGFALGDKALKRVAMDYANLTKLRMYDDWQAFLNFCRIENPRYNLIALSTKATLSYKKHQYSPCDMFIMGQESSGLPQNVWQEIDGALRIDMSSQTRSINVATAASIILSQFYENKT